MQQWVRKEASRDSIEPIRYRRCSVGAVGAAFLGSQLTSARPANAAASHSYTLRMGDKVTIPSINKVCSVYMEGGAPDLFCTKQHGAHHQVVIFRDAILVWKVGNPDQPAWMGKP
jgi:hypothetical protein